MKLTYEMLKKLNACSDGLNWYKAQEPKEVNTLRKTILLALKSQDWEIVQYANWGITRFLSKEQRIEYSIYAAEKEKVLHIFEKQFPNDQRPRKAIQAAKNYLNNPTDENRLAAAWAAADAADAAADAAAAARAALATGEDKQIETLTDIVKFGLTLLKK